MHILFLTDNFPPEVNAPASRTYEHCRVWAQCGHRITIITCAPNFPKGKVMDGYRNRLFQREKVDGMEVIRVWTYITANEGFVRRILDYVSFMVSAIVASVAVRRVDIVVGTSPQFFTACAAFVVGSLKRRPWVFELRDLWPETIKTVGAMRDSSAIRALERLELFLYRRADAIVSVTRSFKRVLETRGVDPSKIHVITNGVDFSQFSPRPKDKDLVRKLGVGGRFVVGYVGTHGMCQALETVVEAAGMINDERVLFVLLGDGARKQALRDAAAAKGVTNILFVDTVSKSEVPAFWSVLDVSLTHLQCTPLFQTVIPSKLFESMGMGIPILHGVDGESAEIVRDCGIGEVFRSEDSRDLADRVMRLANAPEALQSFRENCAKSAKQFDRSELALRMLRVLEETVAMRQVQSSSSGRLP